MRSKEAPASTMTVARCGQCVSSSLAWRDALPAAWRSDSDDGPTTICSCGMMMSSSQHVSASPPRRGDAWVREEAEIWAVCDRYCRERDIPEHAGRDFVRKCVREACENRFGSAQAASASLAERRERGLEWSPLVRAALRAEGFAVVRFLVRLCGARNDQMALQFLQLWSATFAEPHQSPRGESSSPRERKGSKSDDEAMAAI